MTIITKPFSALKRMARSRRWRTAIVLTTVLAFVAARAETVISALSAAPEKSRSAAKGLTSKTREMLGKLEAEEQGDQRDTESTSGAAEEAPPTSAEPSTEMSDAPANMKRSGVESEQPTAPVAGATTAPSPPETIDAGEDHTGTYRPTRAETDEYGGVVTDNEPAGLATGNWVNGDGSASCPDEHPIKGNATSRIYHMPGESSYRQTIPEICFATEEDARAAGYRPRSR